MQTKRRRRFRGSVAAAVLACAVALVAPASGNAAVTIGMLDSTQPNSSCTAANIYLATIVDTNAFPTLTYKVPLGGGVITQWQTRPNADQGQQATLKVIRDSGGTVGSSDTVLASSALQSLTPGVVNSFATRISVSGGDAIGYGVPAGSQTQACYETQTNSNNGVKAGPDPSPGTNLVIDNDSTQRRLNLTATVEPDGDRDGFGDDSQDRCRGAAGANSGCPAGTAPTNPGGSDTTKPTLGRLSFARSSFAAASSGSAFTTQRKKKRKPPVGSKLSFNLTEASSVRFTAERKTTGRRVSRKCKTRTRKNRRKPRCTLYKKVSGSFTVNGKSGKNTITFRGRIGGRKLRTGRYRLTGTATDSAKNASRPVKATFRIVK